MKNSELKSGFSIRVARPSDYGCLGRLTVEVYKLNKLDSVTQAADLFKSAETGYLLFPFIPMRCPET